MREAIQYLLAHPEESRRMGANARRRIETELSLDRYVENIAHVLHAHL
jgi:glycosyltransferase involved in cell wall biosynthesis